MIRPLSDRIVLKPLDKTNVTDSWIYIPESANKERTYIYEVIAVWPWKKDIEMNVKIWDKVLCGQYSWDEIKFEWTEYKIVAMDYILWVVE